MYCINCGKEIKDGAKFCPYCGSEQAEAAPSVVSPEQSVPPAPEYSVPPAEQSVPPAPEYSVPPAVIPDLFRNPAPNVPPNVPPAPPNVPSASPATDRGLPVWGKILIPAVAAVAIIIVLILLGGGGTGGGDGDTVRTPNVVGKYYEDAIPIVENAGMFPVIAGKEYDYKVERNHIRIQDPSARATAPRDSALLIFLSRGEKAQITPGVTPDVAYLPQAEAEEILNEAGIPYTIHYVENDTVLDGLVSAQPGQAGANYEPESGSIPIEISIGSPAQDEALKNAGDTEVIEQVEENRADREAERGESLIPGDTKIGTDQEAEPRASLIPKGAKVGDVITIEGTKYYDKTLQWRILDIKEGRALLITEEIIDLRPYNEVTDRQAALLLDENYFWNDDDFATTWAECSLRTWLNDDFLEDFDTEVVRQILDTAVKNDDNPEYGTPGGADTMDKVFLLSIDEVNKYFVSREDNRAEFHPSDQQLSDIAERISKNPWSRDADLYGNAAATKNYLSENLADTRGAWWWWLRSPGDYYSYNAALVYTDGYVSDSGLIVNYGGGGVRPALYLNLES
ncbi:hypothetical protein AGMMS49983_11890 [Clostridia bacterium]|nr:hypothetical protein AGMMS49983_11890 [Clostridia bacterium]